MKIKIVFDDQRDYALEIRQALISYDYEIIINKNTQKTISFTKLSNTVYFDDSVIKKNKKNIIKFRFQVTDMDLAEIKPAFSGLLFASLHVIIATLFLKRYKRIRFNYSDTKDFVLYLTPKKSFGRLEESEK